MVCVWQEGIIYKHIIKKCAACNVYNSRYFVTLGIFDSVHFYFNHNHMFLNESTATKQVMQEIMLLIISNRMHLLRCFTLSYFRCHKHRSLPSVVNQTVK